jgi:flavin reductase ActVB
MNAHLPSPRLAQPVGAADDLPRRFRDAMATFPSGVTVVTTRDDHGRRWGFTATSFCSVSAEPPLVLVCLAKTANCRQAFLTATHWTVNVLHAEQTDLALHFATASPDKFTDHVFHTDARGCPVLPGACTVVECEAAFTQDAGDHTILVGRVTNAEVGGDAPAVYFRRNFHVLQ